jgi:RNA polymerase sigma factor (sigma-70 family)
MIDSKIISRAISGDPDALTLLINEYKDIAFNLALSIVKDKENAKDITQDSFLRVLENINGFRNESKFSTWLYKIVYNQSIQFVQRYKSAKFINIDSIKTNDFASDLPNGEDKYLELYKSIEQLEDNERNIVMLFYLADKSIKEIILITDLSNSNIKVILHRARKRLQEKLNIDL